MTTKLDSEDTSWLFARALADAPVSLLLLDRCRPDPRIVFASNGFERLTGYSKGEVLGRSLRLLEGPETAVPASNELAGALREARGAHVVLQHYRKDGSRFWNEVTLSPLRNPQGHLSHQICVQANVTSQIESDEAIRESLRLISQAKDEWESTVDSLPELVFLVAADMRVIRSNRAVESWGIGAVRTIPGRNLHGVLHPDCLLAPCHLLELWDRLCEGETDFDVVDCNARDEILARRVHITMHARRAPRPNGSFDSATVIVRDVSDLYEKEKTKRRKDRFEAMGYLVGGLAHEIGNPIAAMKTTVEVWSRSFDTFDRETHQRYLRRMEEGVARLEASAERILGRQGETRKEEIVCVSALLERTLRLFEDQARESGIAIQVEPSSDRDAAILGDAAAIDEVVANVVKNALEACRSADRISISLHLREDCIMIRVRDDGPGIDRSDMEHLFVPFFTTKPTGSGLGLAHVDRLMDEMGGQIEIESAEGGGTSATLRFRRADGAGFDAGT